MENSNNNPKNKSVKQIISDIKDHADMADASYSFFEFLDNFLSPSFRNFKIIFKKFLVLKSSIHTYILRKTTIY